jgi:hypothetical protein
MITSDMSNPPTTWELTQTMITSAGVGALWAGWASNTGNVIVSSMVLMLYDSLASIFFSADQNKI